MNLLQKIKNILSLEAGDVRQEIVVPKDLKSLEYEYPVDRQILLFLKRLVPLALLTKLVVDSLSSFYKVMLSAGAIKVTPIHCSSIYKVGKKCAEILGIEMPEIFIVQDPSINAYTLGDDKKAIIVLHSGLIDHYSEKELMFVIGHEMGHIKSKHMLYNTLVLLLFETAKLEKYLPRKVMTILELIRLPSTLYLPAWSRRSEITADRAGFICTQNTEISCRALIKFDLGVKKLDLAIDTEQYLNQLIDIERGIWKYREYMESHPFTPKRVKCIRLFANSEFVIKRLFSGELKSFHLKTKELDKEVSRIIQVAFKTMPKSVYLNFIMIKLTIAIAWVDCKPDSEEKSLINNLLKFSDLSDDKKMQLDQYLKKGLKIKEVYSDLKNLNRDAKSLIKLCIDICKSDGRINKREMKVLYELGTELKVSKEVIKDIIANKWLRGTYKVGKRIMAYTTSIREKATKKFLRKKTPANV